MSHASSHPPIIARACWIVEPGLAELRDETLPPPAPGEVRVRTLHSAVSRGTEGLVFRGEVPPREAQRMRAPFQAGEFPGPVKYGYISVGVVESGSHDLRGRVVFCLYPHQSAFNVPLAAVHPLPEGVPPARAVLAAHAETALNALWDAAPRPGDRIAVVGAGAIGLMVARLCARIPGCAVEVVDPQPAREAVARHLGATYARPGAATPGADLVFHASGRAEGLRTALALAGFEGEVIELSWYGSRPVTVPLGEDFHAQRLSIRSSQVGHVAAARRARWTPARRLRLALSLLADPALDALVTDAAPFEQLPEVLARLSTGAPDVLCQRIDHPNPADP